MEEIIARIEELEKVAHALDLGLCKVIGAINGKMAKKTTPRACIGAHRRAILIH